MLRMNTVAKAFCAVIVLCVAQAAFAYNLELYNLTPFNVHVNVDYVGCAQRGFDLKPHEHLTSHQDEGLRMGCLVSSVEAKVAEMQQGMAGAVGVSPVITKTVRVDYTVGRTGGKFFIAGPARSKDNTTHYYLFRSRAAESK